MDDIGAVAENVDTTVWRLPFEGPASFLGRTQLKTDAATDIPQQDGNVMVLKLETYSSQDPGGQFLGHENISKRNFARGEGLRFQSRLRLQENPPQGLIGSFISYDVQRDATGMGDLRRDEIDHELLGNEAQVASPHRHFTNVYDDIGFSGPMSGGNPQFHNGSPLPAGFDLTQFHTYRVDWLKDRVKWYVDGQLVRTETTNIPDDPMLIRNNLWVPDNGFADAYHASLQPTATPGTNQTYRMEVDFIEVARLNTFRGDNLLVNPSFEQPTFIPNSFETGGWWKFNQVHFEDQTVDASIPVISGDKALKLFGPFKGQADASGAVQNVPALPGEEFRASVFAQTSTILHGVGDSIQDNENYALVKIEFLDDTGSVLQEAHGDINNLVNTNAKDFPLLDGRDPHIVEDNFVSGTVNAIAPADTSFARIALLFIQLNNEGGSVIFDDASLSRLSLAGDYNDSGTHESEDIDLLFDEIPGNVPPTGVRFDGVIDSDDADVLVRDILGTNYGDTDLDRDVDTSDLVNSIINFTGAGITGKLWQDGDTDGDRDVDTGDVTMAIINFTGAHSSSNVTAVPESSTLISILIGLMNSVIFGRRKNRSK